jgi:hypothetical protein
MRLHRLQGDKPSGDLGHTNRDGQPFGKPENMDATKEGGASHLDDPELTLEGSF